MKDKKILIIGGGKVAHRKLKYMLDFTKSIKIISKQFNDEILKTIYQNKIKYKIREYKQKDIKKFDIIIVAVNSIDIQKEIYYQAKQYNNILVNSVDSKKYCDFILPSYTKTKHLTVAVSTGGSSPAFAKQFLYNIKEIIPNNVDMFLEKMQYYRKKLPKGEDRMKFFSNKVKQLLS